ncbi:MAG: TRAP transporter substrate-binding protein [Spirochaetaceae bacterium]|nr:TRAP transporter substrate-binding protein [Spirochaetaceae bacterium]
MKKSLCCVILMALLAAGMAFAGGSGEASGAGQSFEMSVSYGGADGAEEDITAKEFKKRVEEKSKGQLQVKLYGYEQLGKEVDIVNQLQLGTVDMAIMGTTVHEQGAPTYNIWSAYYIFRDGKEIMTILNGPIGKRMEKAMLDNKSIRIIGYGLRGPRYLTSNRPVRNASEVKGLKIRIPLQPIYVESWKALGAFPEAIAYGELYTALKQGIVDSQENPLSYIHAPHFDEVQKYANETLHQRAFFTYVLSEKFYQRLPGDLQQLLVAEGKSITDFHNALQEKNEAVLRKELQDRGMTFVEVDRKTFEDALKDIPPKFADKWEPRLYEDILAELAKIRR